jgi:hypothetical protein
LHPRKTNGEELKETRLKKIYNGKLKIEKSRRSLHKKNSSALMLSIIFPDRPTGLIRLNENLVHSSVYEEIKLLFW